MLALHQVLDFSAAGLRQVRLLMISLILSIHIDFRFGVDLGKEDAALNVLPAGGFSLHDVYLVHNSHPNLSPRRRAASTQALLTTV